MLERHVSYVVRCDRCGDELDEYREDAVLETDPGCEDGACVRAGHVWPGWKPCLCQGIEGRHHVSGDLFGPCTGWARSCRRSDCGLRQVLHAPVEVRQ